MRSPKPRIARSMAGRKPGASEAEGHWFGPARRRNGGSAGGAGAGASSPSSSCSRQSATPLVFSAPVRTYPRKAALWTLASACFFSRGRAKNRRDSSSASSQTLSRPCRDTYRNPWAQTGGRDGGQDGL